MATIGEEYMYLLYRYLCKQAESVPVISGSDMLQDVSHNDVMRSSLHLSNKAIDYAIYAYQFPSLEVLKQFR